MVCEMNISEQNEKVESNTPVDVHFTNDVVMHIPIEPVPKSRPRITVRGGYARAYTPKKTADFENQVATFVRAFWGKREPITGPVMVEITVLRSRPKRLCRRKDPNHAIPCDTKPDLDNYVKAILDACEKAQIFTNGDQQVFAVNAMKMWAPKGDSGSILVKVIP